MIPFEWCCKKEELEMLRLEIDTLRVEAEHLRLQIKLNRSSMVSSCKVGGIRYHVLDSNCNYTLLLSSVHKFKLLRSNK